MVLFVLIFYSCLVSLGWAAPVSILDSGESRPASVKKTAALEKTSASADVGGHQEGFERMKDFIRQENERLQKIKILTLDLQRADLELKRRQLEVKLAELDRKTPVQMSLNKIAEHDFKLAAIFAHEGIHQAVLEINGAYVQAKEGKPLADGVTVKQVLEDAVVIKRKDGREETLNLGS